VTSAKDSPPQDLQDSKVLTSNLAARADSSEKGVMNEDIQQAIDTGKLDQTTAEALEKLTVGSFCRHKSWGFGQVVEWNLLTAQIFIDFPSKKKHSMQVEYAAETLVAISAEHILARRVTAPDAVREQATADPVGLVRAILADHDGRATVDQISASLVPEVFAATAFKRWWESTKKKLKADGCFQLPAKKTEAVVLLAEPADPGKGLLDKFRGARFLKDQIAAVDEVVKSLDDLANEVQELQSVTSQIEEAVQKGRRLQAAQALELLLARDEILARHNSLAAGEGAPTVADILRSELPRIHELFASLPAAKQRRALEQFPEAFEDKWVDVALRLAKQAPSRLVIEISKLLERHQQTEAMRAALARWVSDRSVSAETLIWLGKERGATFPELFNADLLNAIFSALERDMLAEKRGSRLHDLLLDDRELLGELLKEAKPDAVRDAMRRLLLTPVYDDLNKRSLIGRVIKLYPDIQSMIGGDEGVSDETLTVSWASLEKRKAAYEHLINVEIPQNTKDISTARDQGDLRENFGFKAAKEQQRVLMRRRAESERDLGRARGTNFENPDAAQVSIGTIVLLDLEGGGQETFSILGAWDSAPDHGMVSYMAAIGQALSPKRSVTKWNFLPSKEHAGP